MAQVILHRKRKKRLEQGHPWVYANEIDRVEGVAEPGDVVSVLNHQGLFLGKGLYNPASQISVRMVTYDKEEMVDQKFFVKRVQTAWEYRQRFLSDTHSCRLIYGEADFLPGVIVDKFGEILVVQIVSLGMDQRKEELIEALTQVLQPEGIYERSDVGVRQLEGLPKKTGWLVEPRQDLQNGLVEIRENGLRFLVDIVQGQKTGYFFDQRENRAAIEPLMMIDGQGADVLECFSHTGSFTVHAAAFGAASITCLDISEHAIDSAIRNVELNEFEDRAEFEFIVADAFEQLRTWQEEGRKWDVVILDPPAFAKSKKALEGAYRGYKEINLRGLKLTKEGGYLVTASCSYHLSPEMFRDVIQDAAFDAKKILRLVDWRTAGKDHPQILGVDEGHYLKFAIFQVFSRS